MKSSFGKLRKLVFLKTNSAATAVGGKEKGNLQSSAHLDELVQASEDMRNCYDSLLSAAAATANSAYELSESLREMGTCLLEATPNDDEESGKLKQAQSKMLRAEGLLAKIQASMIPVGPSKSGSKSAHRYFLGPGMLDDTRRNCAMEFKNALMVVARWLSQMLKLLVKY